MPYPYVDIRTAPYIYYATLNTFECFKMHCDVSQWLVTEGTLGGTQYRNTVRKNGKNRNTAWKIIQIPIPHILITFIIGSAYLWVLPSSAFNYLRHLCTRCPCFFNILVVGKFLANFHWKEPFGRSTQNNSWKREKKKNQQQPKPFPRTSSASLDESIV